MARAAWTAAPQPRVPPFLPGCRKRQAPALWSPRPKHHPAAAELLRKGRFDEIFFLDLPTQTERQEIFTVHLQKRRREPQDFDIARLARESAGYVGAEIEQAIIDAMYVGFNAGRELTTGDISAALKRQVPLSVSQREIIGALRNWLREGRAQSASFEAAQERTAVCPLKQTAPEVGARGKPKPKRAIILALPSR